MGRVTSRRRVIRLAGPGVTVRPDTLVAEEPLEIRVGRGPLAVTMRTPGHDFDLAAGFLVSEGVVRRADEVAGIRYCAGASDDGNTYNVVDVVLSPGVAPPDPSLERNFYTTSSCGLCGKASLDAVRTTASWSVRDDPLLVDAAIVAELPDRLRAAQQIFARTGGLHAAGLFSADGRLLCLREDVGRHNAVDKVLGWALREDPPAARQAAAGQRAGFVRIGAEGGDGRHTAPRGGVGAVVACRRPRRGCRAHPDRLPARILDERLFGRAPVRDRGRGACRRVRHPERRRSVKCSRRLGKALALNRSGAVRLARRSDRFPAARRTPLVAAALVVSVAILRGVLDRLWTAATRHPFLGAVREGTITDLPCDRWLRQDALFVGDLLTFHARLAGTRAAASSGSARRGMRHAGCGAGLARGPGLVGDVVLHEVAFSDMALA